MSAQPQPLPMPPVDGATLRSIGSALAQPRKQIEATFVTVGARLSEGASMLNRISKTFEALPAQLQSSELLEASTRLADVGGEARTISALFSTEQADLARLVDVVAAAERPIGELRRAVKMMGIVAINARVVAAGIVGDRDDFNVFTTDIAKLSEGASSTIQQFTAAYRQLTDEVGQAARQRSQFDDAHADTLDRLATGMDTALADLGRQRLASVESSAETGRVSRQIVGRIASAVMALQVGDATRQRIEHVEAGIEALADMLDTGKLQEVNRFAASSFAGSLQLAQLSAAAEAFENDVGEAGDALRDLASDASIITAQSREIYGRGDQSGTSSLAALSEAVRHAALVLHNCEAERSKLEIVASAVLSTVGTLLGHVEAVQEIEANMRLVSLNAAVKCAQLGPRGAALNVIARQLRELTGETVAAAEAAMAGLHQASELAQSFGAAANGDTAGRVGHLEHEATTALGLLQGVDATLAEALSALGRDGPAVIQILEVAAETFADQAAISESMRDLEMQLAEACAPHEGTPTGPIAEYLAMHRTRYTMDAERRIHEKLFGADISAPPAANDHTEETDLDALFF